MSYLKHGLITVICLSSLLCLFTIHMQESNVQVKSGSATSEQVFVKLSDSQYYDSESNVSDKIISVDVQVTSSSSIGSITTALTDIGPQVEKYIALVNHSAVWIKGIQLTVTEKIKLFNTVITLLSHDAFEKEKYRTKITKASLIHHFRDKTQQIGGFIRNKTIFKLLESSSYITPVYISPTWRVPDDKFSHFTASDYKGGAIVDRYFPCTASGRVLEWSRGRAGHNGTCLGDLSYLQEPSHHLDPRFYSYHAWRHYYRSRRTGYGKHTSFSADWNLNCKNCTHLPNAITYAHIIRNALILPPATVYQIDDKIKILPLQCKTYKAYFPKYGHFSRVTRHTQLPTKAIVFSVANQWQGDSKHWSVYHTLGESLTKLAIYADFLTANPHVAIHVKDRAPARKIHELLRIYWKLENEIVYGSMFTKVLILPEGNPCFQPGYLNLQMTQQLLANNMDLHSTTPDSILYIQRTVTRKIKEENDILDFLRQLAQRYNIKLLIFSDLQVPSFYETAHLFHRSLLTIGAHGAGLTNILFATQRTAVFEIVCDVSPATFMHMCHKLGLRHHAFFGSRMGYERCDGGIALNTRLSDFKNKIESVLSIVMKDSYLTIKNN